jgi:hypothetical protein
MPTIFYVFLTIFVLIYLFFVHIAFSVVDSMAGVPLAILGVPWSYLGIYFPKSLSWLGRLYLAVAPWINILIFVVAYKRHAKRKISRHDPPPD